MVVALLPVPVAAEDLASTASNEAHLTPTGTAGVLTLGFWSAALGRDTSSLVYLPTGYRSRGRPSAVSYYLHDAASPFSSARAATERMQFAATADARNFVVVVPDMDSTAWCEACLWINGRNGLGVQAEQYLDFELVPTVERMLNVARDRANRALVGSGMGATGAVVNGLRHPDVFGFVGALGPTLDLAGVDLPASDHAWLLGQGISDEASRRNVSPLDLGADAADAGLELVVSADPQSETGLIAQRVSGVWTELGLPHTLLPRTSSDTDERLFREAFVPRINEFLGGPDRRPWRFSYKSTDTRFRIWGYDVAVTRPNTEFLHLLGARRDGRSLILSGTGSVHVSTPSTFTPGAGYHVVVTPDPKSSDPLQPGLAVNPYQPQVQTVTAGRDGRVTFDADLGPVRYEDETKALLRTGQFTLPHVRVEIDDAVPPPVAAAPPRDPSAPLYLDPNLLPAPFRDWNVRLSTAHNGGNPAGSPQVLQLVFDSPSLAATPSVKRTDGTSYTQIYLPDRYLQSSAALPVLYHLHGTGHGDQHFILKLHELLAQLSFVVVVPDSGGPTSWCDQCQWVDPREFHGAPYDTKVLNAGEDPAPGDTYLHDELIPLIQALFNVRTDRASRAVTGNSMGALGALNQAARHPDEFVFAGGLSGWLDHASNDTPYTPQWVGYFEGQRYPFREQVPALYRDVSPLHNATDINGANIDLLATIGDGCIGSEGYCLPADQVLAEGGDGGESLARANHDVVAPRLDTLGVPYTHPSFRGRHYYGDGDVFRKYYLPRLLQVFADPPPEPDAFSFKTTRMSFEVWDYDVTVARPNFDYEFLCLLGARRDGTDFTLAGSGHADVVTPPAFTPGRTYSVRVAPDAGTPTTRAVVADVEGRLRLGVDLGPGRTRPEHEELVANGMWSLPHTRITVGAPES